MHIEYEKEPNGDVQNLTGQLSSVPWWSVIGTQSTYGEPVVQLKSSSMEPGGGRGDQSTVSKHRKPGAGQAIAKGNATHLGDVPNGPELQTTILNQSNILECQTRLELGFGQHLISAKPPFMGHCYEVLSTFGPPIGRLMLPLNLTTDEGPIYVNAKQYHRIIRRRQCRAKAELKNEVFKARKPYMHESRHLHALRRPRGCGGRFLNTKKSSGGTTEIDGGQLSKATESQNSEVVQCKSGKFLFKDPKSGGPNISGSEATSMHSWRDVDFCLSNALGHSVHSLT